MSNPPDIALSFVRLKCHEQEDTELPIVDNEDDEPYIVVLAIDVGTRTLSGGLGGVSPPPFQVFRVGPMEDIDEGDLKPAPVNQLWNLDGRPAPMSNPDRTVFAVALLENDNADPLQVTNQARTLLQGTLTQTWINASNRTDLDEPARFEFYTTSARTAFESAIDTARGFSPPGAVLDPDDKLGAPQLLRFSADEHRRVLDHAPSTIERTLHFEGDDVKYDLTFAFHHPGIPGWRAPLPIAPPGHAAPGAITAFSRHPEHIDVFWVGPDGGVGTNFWNQAEGWHQPFPDRPARSRRTRCDHRALAASGAHRRVLGRSRWWRGNEFLEPGGGLAPAVPDRSAGPCGARCDHGVLTASRAHRRVLGRAGWWCRHRVLDGRLSDRRLPIRRLPSYVARP